MEHGPVVDLGEPGESALGRAGSGLSLSDGDASASVLSSLGEACDFDADVEHSAEAAELDVPEGTGHQLLQRSTADHADASSNTPAPVPAKRSIPSSPFQHEPEPDLATSQAASRAQPPPTGLTGPDALPGLAPGAALQQGLSQLSEQLSEAASAASMHSREPRPIQAASSDLMEAWNEQEQLEKQSNVASQLHSRLSLEGSDVALSDLAELEQASSMLDSMVESAELMPHQPSSLGLASRQLLEGHQHTSESIAEGSLQAEGDPINMQAKEHEQQHGQHLHESTGRALPKSEDVQSSAGSSTENRIPAEDLSPHSMQPGSDSSAAQDPSAPSTPSAEKAALNASILEQETVAPMNSMPVADASRLRPADNAFREEHELDTVDKHSMQSMYQENESAGDLQPAALPEQNQHASDHFGGLAVPLRGTAEQYSGYVASSLRQSDDERPDLEPALNLRPEAEHAAGNQARPVSGQAGRQQSTEPVGEHGHANIAAESLPNSAAKPDEAAELGQGADRLAHAEALERALATGAAAASRN